MSNKVNLLSKCTSGLPPVIFWNPVGNWRTFIVLLNLLLSLQVVLAQISPFTTRKIETELIWENLARQNKHIMFERYQWQRKHKQIHTQQKSISFTAKTSLPKKDSFSYFQYDQKSQNNMTITGIHDQR